MTLNATISMEAINKFVFFCFNYPMKQAQWKTAYGEVRTDVMPAFLIEAQWKSPLTHVIGKWQEICEYASNTSAAILKFYAELDTSNRMALLMWVLQNYNDEQKLFN